MKDILGSVREAPEPPPGSVPVPAPDAVPVSRPPSGPLWDRCEHSIPESPITLHGICISCYRQRLQEVLKWQTAVGTRFMWADELRATEVRVVELEGKYNDLIMSVSQKHKGETRHDTAKRYILRAETSDGVAMVSSNE